MKNHGLFISFRLLILLTLAIPFFPAFPQDLVGPIAGLVTALMLGLATTAPEPDMIATAGQLRALAAVLLFPLLWMILQLTPLPPFALSNPIWNLASKAMNEPVGFSPASVAPGRTLEALFTGLSLAALFVAGLFICRSREWAAACFVALGAAMALASMQSLLGASGILPGLPTAESTLTASVGVSINFGVLVDSVKRIRRRGSDGSLAPNWTKLTIGGLGIAVCAASLAKTAPPSALIIASCGLVTTLFIGGARRLGVSPRLSLALYAVVAASALFLWSPLLRGSFSISDLSALTDTEAIAASQRAIASAPALGNGVGSFESIIKIYQDARPSPMTPVSTVASIAIEWGRPALLILMVLAIQLFAVTFVGAIRRGRDWIYPSTAAASLFVGVVAAFLDASLLMAANQILLAIVMSVGVGQSASQRLTTD